MDLAVNRPRMPATHWITINNTLSFSNSACNPLKNRQDQDCRLNSQCRGQHFYKHAPCSQGPNEKATSYSEKVKYIQLLNASHMCYMCYILYRDSWLKCENKNTFLIRTVYPKIKIPAHKENIFIIFFVSGFAPYSKSQ